MAEQKSTRAGANERARSADSNDPIKKVEKIPRKKIVPFQTSKKS